MNEDKSALKNLLTTFNATCLGEGDTNAGTNLLVVKAVTLSNLSRTGCGIQASELNRMKAGCSLLVSGALSSSHAVNDVVMRLREEQLSSPIGHVEDLQFATAGRNSAADQ